SASPGRRLTKDVIAAAAAALIAVAAARPHGARTRNVEIHSLDLRVAVGVSKSMLVDDVGATREMTARHLETSRLARARELARAVIDELPAVRIPPVWS